MRTAAFGYLSAFSTQRIDKFPDMVYHRINIENAMTRKSTKRGPFQRADGRCKSAVRLWNVPSERRAEPMQ